MIPSLSSLSNFSRVMRLVWLLGWGGFFFCGNLHLAAQEGSASLPVSALRLQIGNKPADIPLSRNFAPLRRSITGERDMQIQAVLPSFFRENPSGYSFLCRKELQIENSLPIGIWIDAEQPDYLKGQIGNALNLRLKLLRF